MFCYQCEQTIGGKGCTIAGVCGKDGEVAALQDLLIYATKCLSLYANHLRTMGIKNHDWDIFVTEALFTTVTNVNFDTKRLQALLQQISKHLEVAKKAYAETCQKNNKSPEICNCSCKCSFGDDVKVLVEEGEKHSIANRITMLGADIAGLQELLTYGLKGTAAYAEHARILGHEDDDIYAFFHHALSFLTKNNPTIDELYTLCMKCGEINLKVMGLLDTANTGTYGHPIPTQVKITPVKGKAILVSGHDLKDLEELLKQTEGKGINIYTHGEMLPAHGYPGLKKYPHFVGNYGGAWQDQAREFDEFPGAILMTTNCIQRPRESYKARIFTSGLVAWPGVIHIANRDFAPVIKAALEAPGFGQDTVPAKEITVGFGHNAVMGVAGAVIDAVKAGKIRHFFLIGGCDGAKTGRNYYTQFAEAVPQDCVILTLACGKYRFNKLEFGNIGGIPRLLDVGQCNDAYSAIQIAVALAKAFQTDVNGLPLSMILSWYEQKAICILLTLLHLGIKNIRIGPALPAFISPNVLNVLVSKFNIQPISTPQQDLEAILGKK